MRETLRIVGLESVIRGLLQGLETTLTPGGAALSESQSLRLGIARALIGRPRLLILDGVLDALDMRDCPELLPRLFDGAAPWTLLVASTNPAIVGRCNRIAELTPHAGEHAP